MAFSKKGKAIFNTMQLSYSSYFNKQFTYFTIKKIVFTD
jgi:hypothetical protein